MRNEIPEAICRICHPELNEGTEVFDPFIVCPHGKLESCCGSSKPEKSAELKKDKPESRIEPENFWMVWNPKRSGPRVKHVSELEAAEEAARISRAELTDVYVLKAVRHFRGTTVVVEVDLGGKR